MEKSYKYLGFFFLLIIPLTAAAFYKTYIVEFPNFSAKNNVFIHVHASIAVLWISLMIAQPFLIVNKKIQLHRTLGKLSYVVFTLLMLSFIPQIVRIIREGHTPNIFFPVADSVLMIAFYWLAIYNRRDTARHMRYMIAVLLVFLAPTVGRIGPILLEWPGLVSQNVMYGIVYFILIGLILYDQSDQKNFKPYLICIPFFMAHQLVFHVLYFQAGFS